MMSYLKLSVRIAAYLSEELKLNDEKKAILSYAIETLLLGTIGFVLIIGVSALLGVFLPTILATIAGGFLRRLSGGAHFDSPWKCIAFGTFAYVSLGLLTDFLVQTNSFDYNLVYISLIISLVLVIIYAPVDSEAKPIISKKLRKGLKAGAVAFTMLCGVIVIFSSSHLIKTAITLGLLYQSLTLLPVFNK